LFLESSAKTGDGVEEAFFKVARMINTRIEAGKINADSMGSGIQAGGKKVHPGANSGTSSRDSTEGGGCGC